MRLGIVNDSVAARVSLRQALAAAPEHELAWMAKNGAEAVELCRTDRPDLVLMDLYMPVMDGVEATRRIMAATPTAVLVVTSTVPGHRERVFECLSAGALDVVQTPALSGARHEEVARLLEKVGRLGERIAELDTVRAIQQRCRPAGASLVVIGASAGGPGALAQLLGGLPESLPAAVVIVQHIDASFAPGLAEWLDGQSELSIRLGREGDPLDPGVVLIGGAEDRHVLIGADGRLLVRAEPSDLVHRPSIDVLFDSVAAQALRTAVGVLLTGMGSDGARGLLSMRRSGHTTFAQDRETSAVYGMPKAAADLGAATEVLALEDLAAAIHAAVTAT